MYIGIHEQVEVQEQVHVYECMVKAAGGGDRGKGG